MIISALRQLSPGRIRLEFEDGESIVSTLAVVTDMRLYSGRDLSREELNELKLSSGFALARDQALEMLGRRMMSRKELEDKLKRKGQDEATAAAVADWLEAQRLLDDESYAAALARHYSAKGYGPGRLRQELARRGIDRELWQDAAQAMPQRDDKLDRFISLRLKDPKDPDQVRRVTAALYRRGFGYQQIREALERFDAQAEPEELP